MLPSWYQKLPNHQWTFSWHNNILRYSIKLKKATEMECTSRSWIKQALNICRPALSCPTDEVQGHKPQVSCSIFTLNFQQAKTVVQYYCYKVVLAAPKWSPILGSTICLQTAKNSFCMPFVKKRWYHFKVRSKRYYEAKTLLYQSCISVAL